MNYEVNDYRTPPEKPKLGSWPFWIVPEKYAFAYLFRICFLVVALPYLFGFVLTPLGYLLNFLLIDFFTYLNIKTVYEQE